MKNKLNYELLERHIREAAGELNSLLNSIQFMLNRLEKAGELQVDARRNLNEGGLEVSLAHAYHHMNFAWNVRNKTTKEADRHFDRDEKFPRPTGRFDSFARFWPKSLMRKSGRKENSMSYAEAHIAQEALRLERAEAFVDADRWSEITANLWVKAKERWRFKL